MWAPCARKSVLWVACCKKKQIESLPLRCKCRNNSLPSTVRSQPLCERPVREKPCFGLLAVKRRKYRVCRPAAANAATTVILEQFTASHYVGALRKENCALVCLLQKEASNPVLQFGFAGWHRPNQKLKQKKEPSQSNPNCAYLQQTPPQQSS
jgi:hypothetical protein